MTKKTKKESSKTIDLQDINSNLNFIISEMYKGIDKDSTIDFEYSITKSYFVAIGKLQSSKFMNSSLIKEIIEQNISKVESLENLEVILIIRKADAKH